MRFLTLICLVALHAAVPVITGPVSATGTVGAPFAWAIIATGSVTSFDALGLPAGLAIDGVTGVISGTPTAAATTTCTLVASNADGSASASLVLTVAAAGTPLLDNAGSFVVSAGAPCRIRLAATGATSFSTTGLPAGLNLDASTGLISGSVASATLANITATASDGVTATTTSLVVRVLAAVSGAPVFAAPTAPLASVGAPCAYALRASTGSTVAASSLPAGMTIDPATGILTGTPTAAGTANIRCSATNAAGSTATVLEFTVATPAATAPLPQNAALLDGTVGSALAWRAAASAAATWTSGTLPAGLAFDPATGILTGIPTAAALANVTLTASDGVDAASTTCVLRLGAATTGAPTISAITPPLLTIGAPAGLAVLAPTATTWSAANLPAGLALATGTGLITGTPTAAARTAVRLTASNASGSAITTWSLDTIAPASGASVPLGPAVFAASPGAAFSAVVQGTPTTTGVLLTGLPTGLAYDPVTGLITGIPTATSDTNVLASCTNSSGSGTTSLLIDATPAGSGLGDGGPYRLTVGLAARWQVGSGITAITGLPAGLTFADGRITGTPTTAGISHLTCAAGSAQTTVAVLVEAVTGLALADPGVISGTVGTALTAQLAASTGSPTWWTASTLPAGLMFDGATGRISGTPTTAGDTTVAISAGDGAVTVRTSLLISIAPRPDTPQPPLSGVAGGGGCGAGPLGAMLLVLLAGAPWCWRRRSGSRPPIP